MLLNSAKSQLFFYRHERERVTTYVALTVPHEPSPGESLHFQVLHPSSLSKCSFDTSLEWFVIVNYLRIGRNFTCTTNLVCQTGVDWQLYKIL